MTEANPFPDYPVVRLYDNAQEVGDRTIVTEAVRKSRDNVAEYIGQWVRRSSEWTLVNDSLVVGVQGDYGTGKTHLLLDAAAQVEKSLGPLFPDAAIVRVACLDADPVEWFRQGFGPALKRPFMKNALVKLFALAGAEVAEATELTRPAAERLREDYRLIKTLVHHDVLNISAVEGRFRALLAEVCPKDTSETVRLALAGLASDPNEDAAARWLAGEEISERDASRLRLPSASLATAADAAGVVMALAAVQNYVGSPFGVLIDELEHLTRRDGSPGGRDNITWLKRLIEGLAASRALVYISGHDSAWGDYKDFLDRFSRYRPITLRKWTTEDVRKLVEARAPSAPTGHFGPKQAEAVATLTKGNIRRVVSICRALFRESAGFTRPVSEDDVARVAEQIGQSVSISEATQRVSEIVEGAGLRAQPGGVVEAGGQALRRITFDLVGFDGERPRFVAELKHAVNQRIMSAEAHRFVALMGEVALAYPDVLGCFICDGNVDDEVFAAIGSERRLRILAFDLTQRDALKAIESGLSGALRDGRGASPEAERIKELQEQDQSIVERLEVARDEKDDELVESLQREREALRAQVEDLRSQLGESSRKLEEELSAIEQKRKTELEALYKRLEELSRQSPSEREAEIVAPQVEEVTARLQTTYADLTKPLPLSNKLRLTLGNPIAGLGLGGVAVGIILYLVSDGVAGYLNPDYTQYRLAHRQYLLTKYALLSVGIALFLGGLYVLWRRFTQTEAYLDYTARMLREVYLQSPNPMQLVRVSNIMRDCLEDSGPVVGKRRANERLAEEFPEFFSHLAGKAEKSKTPATEAAT